MIKNDSKKNNINRKSTGLMMSNILANNLSLKDKDRSNTKLKEEDKIHKIEIKEHSEEDSHGHGH